MNSGSEKFILRHAIKCEPKTFHFKALLQSTGWISPAFVKTDDQGIIREISGTPIDSEDRPEIVDGFALPGFQNSHSHAFQFPFAGILERADANADEAVTTRGHVMYSRALALDPVQLQAIATMAYAELLKRGYTHVAEFQYLHHDKNGKPYERQAEMSVSLVAAAAIAGIRITLIPVLYQKAGFRNETEPGQRRFIFRNADQYLRLLDDCYRVVRGVSMARLGFGAHSLPAVHPDDLIRIVQDGPPQIPFHIRVAGQKSEINDSLAFLNQRPVEWLLSHLDLTERFHLIHCTHLTGSELERLAKSGAHAIVCPSAAASHGEGIFRLAEFSRYSDRWSIGTDNHIGLQPLEDLRWLDYTQRMAAHEQSTLSAGAPTLLRNAFFSGKRAMGMLAREYFETGQPLDAVIYRSDNPLLTGAGPRELLSRILYTADGSSIAGTLVNGEWICKDAHHRDEESIFKAFRKAMAYLPR